MSGLLFAVNKNLFSHFYGSYYITIFYMKLFLLYVINNSNLIICKSLQLDCISDKRYYFKIVFGLFSINMRVFQKYNIIKNQYSISNIQVIHTPYYILYIEGINSVEWSCYEYISLFFNQTMGTIPLWI